MEVRKTELQQRLSLLHHGKKELFPVIDIKMSMSQSIRGIGEVTGRFINEEMTAQTFLSHDAITLPRNLEFVELTKSWCKEHETKMRRGKKYNCTFYSEIAQESRKTFGAVAKEEREKGLLADG